MKSGITTFREFVEWFDPRKDFLGTLRRKQKLRSRWDAQGKVAIVHFDFPGECRFEARQESNGRGTIELGQGAWQVIPVHGSDIAWVMTTQEQQRSLDFSRKQNTRGPFPFIVRDSSRQHQYLFLFRPLEQNKFEIERVPCLKKHETLRGRTLGSGADAFFHLPGGTPVYVYYETGRGDVFSRLIVCIQPSEKNQLIGLSQIKLWFYSVELPHLGSISQTAIQEPPRNITPYPSFIRGFRWFCALWSNSNDFEGARRLLRLRIEEQGKKYEFDIGAWTDRYLLDRHIRIKRRS